MNDAIVVGSVPAGTKVIRKAEPADITAAPTRLVLFESPSGDQYWLHTTGEKEWMFAAEAHAVQG